MTSTTETEIILGIQKKRVFNVGLFLLGGSIAGAMYYLIFQPKSFDYISKSIYGQESDRLAKNTSKRSFWGSAAKSDPELDEKTIRSHLSAIGFEEMDVSLILHEKEKKNEKIKISEILDELIEKYKKNGKKIIKDAANKQIKISAQKTMVLEETVVADPPDRLDRFYAKNKYEESSCIVGQEEKAVIVITQLEVDVVAIDKLKSDVVTHRMNTCLFALYAASASVMAFRKRCFKSDIFLKPVQISIFHFWEFFLH